MFFTAIRWASSLPIQHPSSRSVQMWYFLPVLHLACLCGFPVLAPALPLGILAGGLGEKTTQLTTNRPATNSCGLAEEAAQGSLRGAEWSTAATQHWAFSHSVESSGKRSELPLCPYTPGASGYD